MVSFCDIPLSQTHYHLEVYGCYGLGLTKSWGIAHAISPVLYTYPGAENSAPVFRAAIRLNRFRKKDHGPSSEQLWREIEVDLDRLLAFMKPYEGLIRRPGMRTRRVRFYDEREWRFVPEIDPAWLPDRALTEKQFRDEQFRSQAQQRLQADYLIGFEPSDIRYVIVSEDDEILPAIKSIEKIKWKYSDDERRLLASRVISSTQIREDL